jgi:hypothetical protein
VTDHHDAVQASLAADTADYAALSRGFAASGDVRRAVLTQWAADLRVLQSLLWESGLGAAPDPAEGLRAVASAMADSWAQHTEHLVAAGSARELLGRARDALAAVFDPSVHALLASRLTPLDHLDDLDELGRSAGDDAPGATRRGYLDWRTPEELLRDLRVAGQDAVRVARAMAEDDPSGSDHHMWQATLALFEAYLVRSALLADDPGLVTAELRWELGGARLAGDDEPGDAHRLRVALTDTLGVLEREGVVAELDDLDRLPEDPAP